jgi:hypothetical protein
MSFDFITFIRDKVGFGNDDYALDVRAVQNIGGDSYVTINGQQVVTGSGGGVTGPTGPTGPSGGPIGPTGATGATGTIDFSGPTASILWYDGSGVTGTETFKWRNGEIYGYTIYGGPNENTIMFDDGAGSMQINISQINSGKSIGLNANSTYITLVDETAGEPRIPGSIQIGIDGIDGTAGQYLGSDGAGNVAWSTPPGTTFNYIGTWIAGSYAVNTLAVDPTDNNTYVCIVQTEEPYLADPPSTLPANWTLFVNGGPTGPTGPTGGEFSGVTGSILFYDGGITGNTKLTWDDVNDNLVVQGQFFSVDASGNIGIDGIITGPGGGNFSVDLDGNTTTTGIKDSTGSLGMVGQVLTSTYVDTPSIASLLWQTPTEPQVYQATYYKTAAQNLTSGSTDITFDGNGTWNNPGGYITHTDGTTDFTVDITGLYQLEFNALIFANGSTWNLLTNKNISIDITRSPTAEQAVIANTSMQAHGSGNVGINYSQCVTATYHLEAGDVINLKLVNTFAGGPPTAQPLSNTFDLNTFFTWRFIS